MALVHSRFAAFGILAIIAAPVWAHPQTTSDEEVARIADEYVAAYEALDAARMGRLLAEDVQFEDPTFRLEETSRAAMMKMVEGAAAGFEDVKIEVHERIIRAPHAVLQVTFVGQRKSQTPGQPEKPIRVRGTTILRVEGGLIRQWTDYFDFRTFAEATKMRVCELARGKEEK